MMMMSDSKENELTGIKHMLSNNREFSSPEELVVAAEEVYQQRMRDRKIHELDQQIQELELEDSSVGDGGDFKRHGLLPPISTATKVYDAQEVQAEIQQRKSKAQEAHLYDTIDNCDFIIAVMDYFYPNAPKTSMSYKLKQDATDHKAVLEL